MPPAALTGARQLNKSYNFSILIQRSVHMCEYNSCYPKKFDTNTTEKSYGWKTQGSPPLRRYMPEIKQKYQHKKGNQRFKGESKFIFDPFWRSFKLKKHQRGKKRSLTLSSREFKNCSIKRLEHQLPRRLSLLTIHKKHKCPLTIKLSSRTAVALFQTIQTHLTTFRNIDVNPSYILIILFNQSYNFF